MNDLIDKVKSIAGNFSLVFVIMVVSRTFVYVVEVNLKFDIMSYDINSKRNIIKYKSL